MAGWLGHVVNNNRVQQITVLGATGSIGSSTLDVIERHPKRYQVYALTAHQQVEKLALLCQRFQPAYAVVATEQAAEQLHGLLAVTETVTQVLCGEQALAEVASAPEVDAVMAAIVGAAGLKPSLAAVKAGKKLLLANKEALVMSGQLLIELAQRSGAVILPIDSEHNAIFQCLPSHYPKQLAEVGVRKLLLTASGGPLRHMSYAELEQVSPAEACAHPNWSMGRKISVDSATLMNKGLELIEACWLFNLPPAQIEVVVHPQSIIHSMVEYVDGSILAQLGNPDMRTPIAHAMAWPERIESGVQSLNFFELAALEFYPPDTERFACLRLAREAMDAGGVAPAILNAANEVAVAQFLAGQLKFTQIPQLIEAVLTSTPHSAADDLAKVYQADYYAREQAQQWLAQHAAYRH